MIRVLLPAHLRHLAGVMGEVELDLAPPVTSRRILDTLEECYPALRGTIRDYGSQTRRPFIRFFACGEDWSHLAPDEPVPAAVADGREPWLIVGALAGG